MRTARRRPSDPAGVARTRTASPAWSLGPSGTSTNSASLPRRDLGSRSRPLTVTLETRTWRRAGRYRRVHRRRASRSGAASHPVLLGVVAEGAEAHAEQFGSLHLDAVGPAQGLRDVLTLDLADVPFEVEARVGQCVGLED